MGGGPTLDTSILSMIKGKTKNKRLVPTMNGNMIHRPMSKLSVPSFFCGTMPPRDAFRISSSVASQPAIFSSREERITSLSSESPPVERCGVRCKRRLVDGVILGAITKEDATRPVNATTRATRIVGSLYTIFSIQVLRRMRVTECAHLS